VSAHTRRLIFIRGVSFASGLTAVCDGVCVRLGVSENVPLGVTLGLAVLLGVPSAEPEYEGVPDGDAVALGETLLDCVPDFVLVLVDVLVPAIL
jgi:hypothetical protein